MVFDSEEELKDIAIERIYKDLKILFNTNKNIFRFEEVPYVSGITDLVIANVSSRYIERRIKDLQLKKSILRNKYLRLYIIIRQAGKLKIQHLAKQTGNNPSVYIQGIKWLTEYGYLQKDGEYLKVTKNFRRHITKTYAFEFKISNWQKALKQAFGAKSYSNIQFVILDDDYIKPALDNRHLFERYNIGLISARPESKFKIYFWPETSKPYSNLGEWRFNEYSLKNIKKSCKIKC